MSNNQKLAALLQKYLNSKELPIDTISNEIEKLQLAPLIESSKAKVLKRIELHKIAEVVIEDEITRYREDLYFFSKRMAENEMEKNIITESQ